MTPGNETHARYSEEQIRHQDFLYGPFVSIQFFLDCEWGCFAKLGTYAKDRYKEKFSPSAFFIVFFCVRDCFLSFSIVFCCFVLFSTVFYWFGHFLYVIVWFLKLFMALYGSACICCWFCVQVLYVFAYCSNRDHMKKGNETHVRYAKDQMWHQNLLYIYYASIQFFLDWE